MVWISVVALAQDMSDEHFLDPVFVSMVSSLMKIRAIPELSETKLDSSIAAICRQNQNSKVAVVSSYQWAVLLRGLHGVGVTMAEAMQKYKQHPDVIAYSMSAAGPSLDGEAGLLLDHQKETCIVSAEFVFVLSCYMKLTPCGAADLRNRVLVDLGRRARQRNRFR